MKALVKDKSREYIGHFSFPLVNDLDKLIDYFYNRIKDAKKEAQKIIDELDLVGYEFQFELDKEEIKGTYINIYISFTREHEELKDEIKGHKTAIKKLQKRLKDLEE